MSTALAWIWDWSQSGRWFASTHCGWWKRLWKLVHLFDARESIQIGCTHWTFDLVRDDGTLIDKLTWQFSKLGRISTTLQLEYITLLRGVVCIPFYHWDRVRSDLDLKLWHCCEGVWGNWTAGPGGQLAQLPLHYLRNSSTEHRQHLTLWEGAHD